MNIKCIFMLLLVLGFASGCAFKNDDMGRIASLATYSDGSVRYRIIDTRGCEVDVWGQATNVPVHAKIAVCWRVSTNDVWKPL